MKEVSLFCHFSISSTGLHCVESYENLSQGFVGEGWVAADNEKKTTIFPE